MLVVVLLNNSWLFAEWYHAWRVCLEWIGWIHSLSLCIIGSDPECNWNISLIVLLHNFLAFGEGLWFDVTWVVLSPPKNSENISLPFGLVVSLTNETCKWIRHAFICINWLMDNFCLLFHTLYTYHFFFVDDYKIVLGYDFNIVVGHELD